MDIKYFYAVLITIFIYQLANLLLSLSSDEKTFLIWNIWIFYPIMCLFAWGKKFLKNKDNE